MGGGVPSPGSLLLPGLSLALAPRWGELTKWTWPNLRTEETRAFFFLASGFREGNSNFHLLQVGSHMNNAPKLFRSCVTCYLSPRDGWRGFPRVSAP